MRLPDPEAHALLARADRECEDDFHTGQVESAPRKPDLVVESAEGSWGMPPHLEPHDPGPAPTPPPDTPNAATAKQPPPLVSDKAATLPDTALLGPPLDDPSRSDEEAQALIDAIHGDTAPTEERAWPAWVCTACGTTSIETDQVDPPDGVRPGYCYKCHREQDIQRIEVHDASTCEQEKARLNKSLMEANAAVVHANSLYGDAKRHVEHAEAELSMREERIEACEQEKERLREELHKLEIERDDANQDVGDRDEWLRTAEGGRDAQRKRAEIAEAELQRVKEERDGARAHLAERYPPAPGWNTSSEFERAVTDELLERAEEAEARAQALEAGLKEMARGELLGDTAELREQELRLMADALLATQEAQG